MKKRTVLFLAILLIISLIFDAQISSFITSNRSESLTNILLSLELITSGWFVVPFISLLFIKKDKRKYLLDLLISFLVALFLTYALKSFIGRPRPINALIGKNTNSFPSGHVTTAAVPIPFLNHYPRFKYAWLAILLIISFTRIYLGLHYLSDVVAAILIGYVISNLVIYFNEKYKLLRWY